MSWARDEKRSSLVVVWDVEIAAPAVPGAQAEGATIHISHSTVGSHDVRVGSSHVFAAECASIVVDHRLVDHDARIGIRLPAIEQRAPFCVNLIDAVAEHRDRPGDQKRGEHVHPRRSREDRRHSLDKVGAL